jgi:hypothetical protein
LTPVVIAIGCVACDELRHLELREAAAEKALRAFLPTEVEKYRPVKSGHMYPSSTKWIAYETSSPETSEPVSRVRRVYCYQGTPWRCAGPHTWWHVVVRGALVKIPEPPDIDDKTIVDLLSVLGSECVHGPSLETIQSVRRQGDLYKILTAIGHGDMGQIFYLEAVNEPSACKWKVKSVGEWISAAPGPRRILGVA